MKLLKISFKKIILDKSYLKISDFGIYPYVDTFTKKIIF